MKIFIPMLAVSVCLSATCASALTITVNDNIPDTSYLAPQSTMNGAFDLASALPSGGSYLLTSAFATFLFQDNADTLSQETITGAWVSQDNGNKFMARYIDTWTINPAEGVSLSIAGSTQTGQTAYSESLQEKSSSFYFVGSGSNKVKYTTIERSGEKGYSGDFELSQALDTSLLTNLSQIAFSLTGIEGNLIYKSGTLTAKFEQMPVAAPNEGVTSSTVPEPSTVALLGLGLTGMGIAARRRKKN